MSSCDSNPITIQTNHGHAILYIIDQFSVIETMQPLKVIIVMINKKKYCGFITDTKYEIKIYKPFEHKDLHLFSNCDKLLQVSGTRQWTTSELLRLPSKMKPFNLTLCDESSQSIWIDFVSYPQTEYDDENVIVSDQEPYEMTCMRSEDLTINFKITAHEYEPYDPTDTIDPMTFEKNNNLKEMLKKLWKIDYGDHEKTSELSVNDKLSMNDKLSNDNEILEKKINSLNTDIQKLKEMNREFQQDNWMLSQRLRDSMIKNRIMWEDNQILKHEVNSMNQENQILQQRLYYAYKPRSYPVYGYYY